MKRYLLFIFHGDNLHDSSGWRSFHASYDTPEAAKKAFIQRTRNGADYYGHIVDTQLPEEKAVLLVCDGYGEWSEANGYA